MGCCGSDSSSTQVQLEKVNKRTIAPKMEEDMTDIEAWRRVD